MSKTYYLPVLSTLFGVSRKYKKYYSFPSQKKICQLLSSHQGVDRSRRTLNRWLRCLEDEGIIRRRRRIRLDKKLGMVFQSTLYMITKKGYKLLYKCGVDCWNVLKKLQKSKFSAKYKDNVPEFAQVRPEDRITREEIAELRKAKKPRLAPA